mgnify:CR=1 FL=1
MIIEIWPKDAPIECQGKPKMKYNIHIYVALMQ